MTEMGDCQRIQYAERVVHPSRLSNEEYDRLVATFHTEQRDFLLLYFHAGTGKSLDIGAVPVSYSPL